VSVLQLAHTHMTEAAAAGTLADDPYHLVIVSPDGPPTYHELATPDAVCVELALLRERVVELANLPPDEEDEDDEDGVPAQLMFWVYVFRGKRLPFAADRLWQLQDGERIHDITPPPISGDASGCVVVAMPEPATEPAPGPEESGEPDDTPASA